MVSERINSLGDRLRELSRDRDNQPTRTPGWQTSWKEDWMKEKISGFDQQRKDLETRVKKRGEDLEKRAAERARAEPLKKVRCITTHHIDCAPDSLSLPG